MPPTRTARAIAIAVHLTAHLVDVVDTPGTWARAQRITAAAHDVALILSEARTAIEDARKI